MVPQNYVSLRIRRSTYARLMVVGVYGESRSGLIERLLDAYQEYLHLKEELCLKEYVPVQSPPSP